MSEANQAKYILPTLSARNRAGDLSGLHSTSVLRLESARDQRSRRRIGIKPPAVNAEIPAKLAAFAAALTMNGLLAAGMAYLFNVPLEHRPTPLEQRATGIAGSGADEPLRSHGEGNA
jgi:hypothetical protein